MIRTRWAAVGAAVAVTLGTGGLTFVDAAKGSGDRPVTVTIDPCRLRDTRPSKGVGGRTTPLGPAEAYTVQGTGPSGNCDIPTDASGLVLNVTADQATQATNLRVYPTGGTVPTTSNLNPRPGAPPTPNGVTVGLDGAGQFTIRNAKGSVHVIIDVTAYLVHHHHDETKAISLDVLAAPLGGSAYYYASGSSSDNGIRFPATGFPSIGMTAVLPPDATAGGTVRIDVYWHIGETGCITGLDNNFALASRLGESGLLVIPTVIPYINLGPIATNEVRVHSTQLTTAGGFEPGDIIKFGVYRSTLGGGCEQDIWIDGARLLYDQKPVDVG